VRGTDCHRIDRLSHMSTLTQDLSTFVKAMIESGFDKCMPVAKVSPLFSNSYSDTVLFAGPGQVFPRRPRKSESTLTVDLLLSSPDSH
jgi:hypothetical protein